MQDVAHGYSVSLDFHQLRFSLAYVHVRAGILFSPRATHAEALQGASAAVLLAYTTKEQGLLQTDRGTVTGVYSCNGLQGHYNACYKGACPVMDYKDCNFAKMNREKRCE